MAGEVKVCASLSVVEDARVRLTLGCIFEPRTYEAELVDSEECALLRAAAIPEAPLLLPQPKQPKAPKLPKPPKAPKAPKPVSASTAVGNAAPL